MNTRTLEATRDGVLSELADRLRDARLQAKPISPLRHLCEPNTATAYALQAQVAARRTGEGGRVVGRKIAMTSAAVQKQFGIEAPTSGVLFDDMLEVNGARLRFRELVQPRIEAEVAFVLKRDLDLPCPTFLDVIGAVDYALAAIEVADCRIEDWNVEAFDFVADNSAAGKVVLGDAPFDVRHRSLGQMGMVTEVDGETRSLGSGAACLGNPLKALWWLARSEAPRCALRRGELVMSGSLGPAIAVKPGACVQMTLDGLPPVRVSFQ